MYVFLLTLVELILDHSLCDSIEERRNAGRKWWADTFFFRPKHSTHTEYDSSALDDYYFYPETQSCCGLTMEPVLKSKNAQLFIVGAFPFRRSHVYVSDCSQCQARYHFDGRRHGVLNYGNSYLFDVELFYELMELKVNAGLPTHAWWKAKVDVCLKIYGKSEDSARARKLWMGLAGRLTSFLHEFLTIIDYPRSLFSCCDNPEIICADGKKAQ
jgi:hypothetical protein